MPEEIRLSSLTFTIERVKNLKNEDGDECYGLVHAGDQNIEIDNGIRNHDTLRLKFIHELVHCMEDHAGVNLKEIQVDSFARSIYSMIVDNPELVTWLTLPKPVRKRRTEEAPDAAT